jgi:hypothetical protein
VIQHTIRILQGQHVSVDIVVVLECTSPLMRPRDIDAVVCKLEGSGGRVDVDVVCGVCRDHTYQLRLTDDGVKWISYERDGTDQRRQDLPLTYRLAGGIYAYYAEAYLRMGTSFYGRVETVEIPEERAIDVDTPLDLHVVRALAAMRHEWIVIGSSPSAAESLQRAYARNPLAKTITTNRGHALFRGDRGPDVYHLHDMNACQIHHADALRMAGKGVWLTTLRRQSERALRDRGVDGFDEFLELASHDHPGRFQRGQYASCGLSGLICLQYVLNHGATHVHLVGMEGYADDEHYFDGSEDLGAEKNKRFTTTLIQPFIQSCIDACPDVRFTFYGNLNYEVSGSNVACQN